MPGTLQNLGGGGNESRPDHDEHHIHSMAEGGNHGRQCGIYYTHNPISDGRVTPGNPG